MCHTFLHEKGSYRVLILPERSSQPTDLRFCGDCFEKHKIEIEPNENYAQYIGRVIRIVTVKNINKAILVENGFIGLN